MCVQDLWSAYGKQCVWGIQPVWKVNITLFVEHVLILKNMCLMHVITIFLYFYAYHAIFTQILILYPFNVQFILGTFDFLKTVKHFESKYFLEF